MSITLTDLNCLLDHLPPGDAVALVERLPARRRREALAGMPPAEGEARRALLSWVVEHGGREDGLALLEHPLPRRDVFEALATAPDPEVRAAAYMHPAAPTDVRRRMVAGRVGGPLKAALLATRSRRRLGPALDSANRDVAAHATRVVRGPRFQPVPQRPEAVHAWLVDARPPEAVVRARRHHSYGPRRRRIRDRLAAVAFEAWNEGDWEAFVRLLHERPLDSETADILAADPRCPASAGLAVLRREGPAAGHAGALLAGLHAGTFTADDVYTRAVHAPAVLFALSIAWRTPEFAELPGVQAAHDRLADAVRAELGDDPARWLALLALVRTGFAGTVPELLRAAASGPVPAELPPPPPPLIEPAAPHSTRGLPNQWAETGSPWAFVLCLAEPARLGAIVSEVAAALPDTGESSPLGGWEHALHAGWARHKAELSDLPYGTSTGRSAVHAEILRLGLGYPIPAELATAFAGIADESALLAFLALYGGRGDIQEIAVAWRNPAVDVALLRRWGTSEGVRRLIVSRMSLAPGEPGHVPLHGGAWDGTDIGCEGGRGVFDDLLGGDDPTLIGEVLCGDGALCVAHQVAACRRLVELGRLDLAAGFLRTEPASAESRAPGPRAAVVEGLGPAVTAADPAAVRAASAEMIRTLVTDNFARGSGRSLVCMLAADRDTAWATVHEMVSRPDAAPHQWARLLGLADMPDAVAALALAAAPERFAPTLAASSPGSARAALETAALPRLEHHSARADLPETATWVDTCLDRGLLTLADVLTQGRPAGAALRSCRRRMLADDPHARSAVRDLIDVHGPVSTEAWVVVANLLDDFTGTLPDLLTLAVAATAPVPGRA
ncbi:hypothetical protein [Yinghuangia seranimata]|uniref:hypothetical protein n=1 Tax=Yinghuangia seranimata TaxID=408067 RepID=UPI00248AB77A|nr:hypothetical protein [Yinghuangia seranimata]MDI2131115.1 hypothetical protein [Yinghuangia seranimata]